MDRCEQIFVPLSLMELLLKHLHCGDDGNPCKHGACVGKVCV